MADLDALKYAMRVSDVLDKRAARAERTRAAALSPLRFMFRLLMTPVTAVAVAVSLYVSTSPWNEQDALRHLVAMAGCEAAAVIGVAHASVGNAGYHVQNDLDGNGIACETDTGAYQVSDTAETASAPSTASGAKFIRPDL